MAFQTGTITNSHELVDKIYGFLLGIGWEHVATLKTGEHNPPPDGYDFVFHSTGEDGLDDIYIRVAAGECDVVPYGDIQHPFLDGYTEFINGFAYQHFPASGTSPEDGFNELGRYGPLLYVADWTDDPYFGYIDEYNLLKSSDTPRRRRRIDLDGLLSNDNAAFDGRRYLYQRVRTGSESYPFRRGDLYSGLETNMSNPDWYNASSNMSLYTRRDDGVEYIYCPRNVTGHTENKRFLLRFNVANNNWTKDGIDGPPYYDLGTGYYGSFGCQCVGVKRRRDPFNYWMYGFMGANGGGEYRYWSQFNINDEVWGGFNSPNTPWGLGQYAYYKPFCVYVTKEQSGYEHDRIYIWEGDQRWGFASIAIGDDGYVAPAPYGTWTTHADTLVTQNAGLHATCVGRTILMSGTATASKSLYKWELPEGDPTQVGTWELVGSNWTRNGISTGPYIFHADDRLCNRVRVSEFENNTYWLFADLNRLVVVVKNAFSKYEYMYVGKFQAYANPVSTTITADVEIGDTSIRVADPSLFEVNQKYMICETTGQNVMYTESSIIDYQRKIAPSEIFTVVENTGNGILTTSKFKAKYYAGSRVGEDPMPITCRVHSIERAQTFDVINLVDDNGYSDPAWQLYSLTPTVDLDFANATDIEERSLGTFLYSIVLINEGDSYVGKEVRGQLMGVYSCGTAISSEEEISVGSKKYLAFAIDNSGESQRIVVGPK